jgi:heme exporter protein CcmD
VNYVAGGYGVTVVVLVAYAWHLVRRGRSLTRDLPEEEQPWR